MTVILHKQLKCILLLHIVDTFITCLNAVIQQQEIAKFAFHMTFLAVEASTDGVGAFLG